MNTATPEVSSPKSNSCKMYVPKRYILCLMVFLGLFNVYTLRNTLSVAIVQMKNDGIIPQTIWGISSQDVILTSFYPLYIVANLFGGSLGERFGSKLVFGVGILLTSLVTLFIPLASYHSMASLVFIRVLQGIFEGLSIPVAYTIYGKWFPKSERTFLRTCCEIGFDAGFLVGNPVAGVLCASKLFGGWSSVFYFFGGFSVIWSLVWWLVMHETPSEHPYISAKEREFIIADQGEEVAQNKVITPWISILRSPVIWSMIIASFISGVFVMFIRQDYPSYLDNVYGMKIQDVGLFSMMPQLLDLIVSVLASFLGDYVINHSDPKHRTLIRKAFNVASAVPTAAAQVGLIFLGDNKDAIIWMMAAAYGLGGLDACGSAAIPVDISPVFAGSIFGILNAFGNVSSIFAPLIIGKITAGHESDRSRWNIVFIVAIVTNVASTLIFVLFVSADLQPWGLEGETLTTCCRRGPRRPRPSELHPSRLSRVDQIIVPYQPDTNHPCPQVPLSTIRDLSASYHTKNHHHSQTAITADDSTGLSQPYTPSA